MAYTYIHKNINKAPIKRCPTSVIIREMPLKIGGRVFPQLCGSQLCPSSGLFLHRRKVPYPRPCPLPGRSPPVVTVNTEGTESGLLPLAGISPKDWLSELKIHDFSEGNYKGHYISDLQKPETTLCY